MARRRYSLDCCKLFARGATVGSGWPEDRPIRRHRHGIAWSSAITRRQLHGKRSNWFSRHSSSRCCRPTRQPTGPASGDRSDRESLGLWHLGDSSQLFPVRRYSQHRVGSASKREPPRWGHRQWYRQ